MRAHLELVVIDLGDSDDPHVIFETLNARGTAHRRVSKPLADAPEPVRDKAVR